MSIISIRGSICIHFIEADWSGAPGGESQFLLMLTGRSAKKVISWSIGSWDFECLLSRYKINKLTTSIFFFHIEKSMIKLIAKTFGFWKRDENDIYIILV